MCLFIPPKPKKANKAKGSPKQSPRPPTPRYSRMPTRPCCAPASPALHQTDLYGDYLQQPQSPDDQSASTQYSTQLGLHRLDDTVHVHAEKNYQATETVGKAVKDIQERLDRMEGSLKEAGEAADAIWDFCDDEKDRKWHKTEAKRREHEYEMKRDLEKMKELVEKKEKKKKKREEKREEKAADGESKSLHEAEMLKLLAERDMRWELERLRTNDLDKTESKNDGFLSETQLQKILDQRAQAKELQRLQAQQKGAPPSRFERPDFVTMLDHKDGECDSASAWRQKRGSDKPTTRGESEGQEQIIDDMLANHNQKRGRKTNRDRLRGDRRRHASPSCGYPSSTEGDLHQTAIDEIPCQVFQQQTVSHAVGGLESLLHRPESTTHLRTGSRKSDRQWIPTEVLRYLDTAQVDRGHGGHDNDHFESHAQTHGNGDPRRYGGGAPAYHHARVYTSPPCP